MPDSVAISEALVKETQLTGLINDSVENLRSNDASDNRNTNILADVGQDKDSEMAGAIFDCDRALQNDNEDSEMVVVCDNVVQQSEGDDFIGEKVYSPSKGSMPVSDSEMSEYSNESSFDQNNLHMLIPEVELKAALSEDMSDEEYDPLLDNEGENSNQVDSTKLLENNDDDSSSPKVKLSCPLCRKSFYNSKGLNSHVVKKHNTTLGPKFSCHICGATGGSRSSLKRHLRRTHKVTTFLQPELFTRKCTHCDSAFPSHMELYEHIRASHSDELHQYFHCNSCPAVIRAKASFIRHLRRSHPGQEQAYLTIENCTLCSESFTSKQGLQRHIKQTHPDMSYPCDQCESNFKHNYLLTRHKLTHLPSDDLSKLRKIKKRYKVNCEECGRTYDSKKRLEKHILIAHTLPPPIQPPKVYPCRICNVVSFSAKQNRKHYRRIHLKQRLKVHCSQCNITFKTAEECAQHRVLHPTTCDICKKQFLRRDSLREHLMIHADPRHQCPHCPKKFTQSSNLKRHIRVHTGEKPYQCPFCNRRFSDKSACNSHIRVHTGAERSVCEVCGASFSKKQRLNYHMKMHTGKGLIRCPICSRAHTNSYPLRKHVQSHCQPLTNALVSLGLNRLISENPHLVIDSLNLLTEQALEQSVRETNVNGESDAPTIKIEKTDSLDIKTENFEFDESRSLIERYRSPAALTQLLKDVFKVQQVYAVPKEEPEAQPELPNTFADELVKQCLEVIMKAEPRDEDEVNFDAENDPLDPLDITPEICEEIPKIKISRKIDAHDKEGAVFVAEFIK